MTPFLTHTIHSKVIKWWRRSLLKMGVKIRMMESLGKVLLAVELKSAVNSPTRENFLHFVDMQRPPVMLWYIVNWDGHEVYICGNCHLEGPLLWQQDKYSHSNSEVAFCSIIKTVVITGNGCVPDDGVTQSQHIFIKQHKEISRDTVFMYW